MVATASELEVEKCARCGAPREKRETFHRCIGCGDWICTRTTCARSGYENLADRAEGWVCPVCIRKREMVPRAGGGRGAGSAAGVEAIERGRYYLYEATGELETRLRQLSGELAESLGQKLGHALEEALARGLERGSGYADAALRRTLDDASRKLRAPLVVAALVTLLVNVAITVGLVMLLRR